MTFPLTPYERIGGERIARAALDDFIARAQADDRLADVFGLVITAGARAFVAVSMDAGRADGRDDVEPALAWLTELGLGDDELDLILDHLTDALMAQGVAEEIIAEIADQAEALRDAALLAGPDEEDEEDEDEEVAA
jgi:truncated hemoglobin YjbI